MSNVKYNANSIDNAHRSSISANYTISEIINTFNIAIFKIDSRVIEEVKNSDIYKKITKGMEDLENATIILKDFYSDTYSLLLNNTYTFEESEIITPESLINDKSIDFNLTGINYTNEEVEIEEVSSKGTISKYIEKFAKFIKELFKDYEEDVISIVEVNEVTDYIPEDEILLYYYESEYNNTNNQLVIVNEEISECEAALAQLNEEYQQEPNVNVNGFKFFSAKDIESNQEKRKKLEDKLKDLYYLKNQLSFKNEEFKLLLNQRKEELQSCYYGAYMYDCNENYLQKDIILSLDSNNNLIKNGENVTKLDNIFELYIYIKSNENNYSQRDLAIIYEKLISLSNGNIGYFDSTKMIEYTNYLFDEKYKNFITPEQINTYNYIFEKEGKLKADAYFRYIEESINLEIARVNIQNTVEEIQALDSEDDVLSFMLKYGIITEVGLKDGVVSFCDGVKNFFGSSDGVASVNDCEKVLLLEAISEIKGAQTVYNISNSIGNMAIPMAASATIGILTKNPDLGKKVGSLLMFISASGNSTEESLQSGNNYYTSLVYGYLNGSTESVTEYLLGGIPGLSKIDDIPGLRGILLGACKEATQEMMQTSFEQAFDAIINGNPYDFDVKEILISGYYGFLTALCLNAGKNGFNLSSQKLKIIGSKVYTLIQNGNALGAIEILEKNGLTDFANIVKQQYGKDVEILSPNSEVEIITPNITQSSDIDTITEIPQDIWERTSRPSNDQNIWVETSDGSKYYWGEPIVDLSNGPRTNVEILSPSSEVDSVITNKYNLLIKEGIINEEQVNNINNIIIQIKSAEDVDISIQGIDDCLSYIETIFIAEKGEDVKKTPNYYKNELNRLNQIINLKKIAIEETKAAINSSFINYLNSTDNIDNNLKNTLIQAIQNDEIKTQIQAINNIAKTENGFEVAKKWATIKYPELLMKTAEYYNNSKVILDGDYAGLFKTFCDHTYNHVGLVTEMSFEGYKKMKYNTDFSTMLLSCLWHDTGMDAGIKPTNFSFRIFEAREKYLVNKVTKTNENFLAQLEKLKEEINNIDSTNTEDTSKIERLRLQNIIIDEEINKLEIKYRDNISEISEISQINEEAINTIKSSLEVILQNSNFAKYRDLEENIPKTFDAYVDALQKHQKFEFNNLDVANELRSMHALESSIHVLENRSYFETLGVSADEIALIIFAHTKSNSGIGELNTSPVDTVESGYKDAIKKINKRIENYNSYIDDENDKIKFNLTTEDLKNNETFKRISEISTLLRFSDAFAKKDGTTQIEGKILCYDSSAGVISKDAMTGYLEIMKDSKIYESEGILSDEKEIKLLIDSGLDIKIEEKDGTITTIKDKSCKFILGEGNVLFHFEEKTDDSYVYSANVIESSFAPATTFFAIKERLGEVKTQNGVKRIFKINMELEQDSEINEYVREVYMTEARKFCNNIQDPDFVIEINFGPKPEDTELIFYQEEYFINSNK